MKNRKRFFPVTAIALALAVLVGQLAGYPLRADAASSGEIREQINELEGQGASLQAQIEELEQKLSDNVTEMKDVVAQKQLIDQQITLQYAQIENINEQIAAYGVLIADKQEELDAAQARFQELSDKNIERIRTMEEKGSLTYWSVLFKASSFADFLDRMNMVQEIAAADHRRLEELNEAAQEVSQAQTELEAEKQALEGTKDELDAAYAALEEKRAQADALLTELIARGEEYELMMIEAEIAQSSVMQQIAAKEAEYENAVYQEWLATYVPPTTTAPPTTAPPTTEPTQTTQPGETEDGSTEETENGSQEETEPNEEEPGTTMPPSEDYWLTPLDWYILTSPFGLRVHPILGYERMHEGVDLACNAGSPIYASRSGLVTTAEWDDACGNYVVINHLDGYMSIYMHMTNYAVSAGEYVTQGQVIGYVGDTGLSDGDHLHFGIAYNGTYVNPMEYIG